MTSWGSEINYKPKVFTKNKLKFWKPKNKIQKDYRKDFWKASYMGIHQYKITMGKPIDEPRTLRKLDSWQTVVVNMGTEKENISNEFKNKLLGLNMKEKSLRIKKELISYWSINGKEEREQIVCIFNRSYVFLHLYIYGKDLYVGWDAHLNYTTWEEYKVSDGYTNGRVKNISLYSIKPVWREVNEYDLNDINFLLETVHTNIIKILKRVIKEKKIDQEIDFRIVRESRTDALKAEKPKEDNRSKFRRLS